MAALAWLESRLNKMLLEEHLANGIMQLGMNIPEKTQQQLLKYIEIIQKWNKVYNLTAIRDPKQMVSSHLLDSLAVVPHLWAGRWLDVGCGAGLPGVVIAILRPEWKFSLLDSNSKKTSFVQQACIELGISNVQVYCERVEAWNDAEKFDGIISRAFAETAEFVSITRHLMKVGGKWAAMKGVPELELERLPKDIVVEQKISLHVPNLEAARCLIVLREDI